MNYNDDKESWNDKEYRRKLYEENKELYKVRKADFTYGVSTNFRQRRNDHKNELKHFEEDTRIAYEEEENI